MGGGLVHSLDRLGGTGAGGGGGGAGNRNRERKVKEEEDVAAPPPTLVHARSKLQYLKGRERVVVRGSRDGRVKLEQRKREQERRDAKGRRDMYGGGKATLVVLNDDSRRMRKGKQWKPDLNRPRVKNPKNVDMTDKYAK